MPSASTHWRAGASSHRSRPATAPARCTCAAFWPRSGPSVADAAMRAATSSAATTAVSSARPSSPRARAYASGTVTVEFDRCPA